MQQMTNPYLEFGKAIIAKHSGLGYYYDSLALIHPEYEGESEEKTWEKNNYITNVTHLHVLKEYNNLFQNSLTFLTQVMEKKVINQFYPSFELRIEKKIEELLPGVEKEIIKRVTEQYLLSKSKTEVENLAVFQSIIQQNQISSTVSQKQILQVIRNIENYETSVSNYQDSNTRQIQHTIQNFVKRQIISNQQTNPVFVKRQTVQNQQVNPVVQNAQIIKDKVEQSISTTVQNTLLQQNHQTFEMYPTARTEHVVQSEVEASMPREVQDTVIQQDHQTVNIYPTARTEHVVQSGVEVPIEPTVQNEETQNKEIQQNTQNVVTNSTVQNQYDVPDNGKSSQPLTVQGKRSGSTNVSIQIDNIIQNALHTQLGNVVYQKNFQEKSATYQLIEGKTENRFLEEENNTVLNQYTVSKHLLPSGEIHQGLSVLKPVHMVSIQNVNTKIGYTYDAISLIHNETIERSIQDLKQEFSNTNIVQRSKSSPVERTGPDTDKEVSGLGYSSQMTENEQNNGTRNEQADSKISNQGGNQNSNQGGNQNSNQGSNQNSNQGGNQNSNQGGNQNSNQGSNQNSNQGSNQNSNQNSNQGNNRNSSQDNNQNSTQNSNRNQLIKLVEKHTETIFKEISHLYRVDHYFSVQSGVVKQKLQELLIAYVNGSVSYEQTINNIEYIATEYVNSEKQVQNRYIQNHSSVFSWLFEKNKPERMLEKQLPIEKLVQLELSQEQISGGVAPVVLEHITDRVLEQNVVQSHVLKEKESGNYHADGISKNTADSNISMAKKQDSKISEATVRHPETASSHTEVTSSHTEVTSSHTEVTSSHTEMASNQTQTPSVRKRYNYRSWIENNLYRYKNNMSFLQDIHLQQTSPLIQNFESVAVSNLIYLMGDKEFAANSPQAAKKRMMQVLQKEAVKATGGNTILQSIFLHPALHHSYEDQETHPLPMPVQNVETTINKPAQLFREPVEFVYETPPVSEKDRKQIAEVHDKLEEIETETVHNVVHDIEFVRETQQIVDQKVEEQIVGQKKKNDKQNAVSAGETRRVMEQIEKTIDRKMDESVEQIANKVYRNIEDRLRSERNRRGY